MRSLPIPLGMALVVLAGAPVSTFADFGPASTGASARAVIEREPLRALAGVWDEVRLWGTASTHAVVAKRGGSRQGGGRKSDQTGAGGYRQQNPRSVGQGGGSGPQNNSGKFVDQRPPNNQYTNPVSPPGPRSTAPNAR